MFIELVDVLRCPAAHEETWLVASADRMLGRHIVEGSLGCPICRARYPIRDGITDFSGGVARTDSESEASTDVVIGDGAMDEAMRLAALLDLTEPGQRVLLAGSWARLAERLLEVTPLELMLLDAPAPEAGDGRSPIVCGPRPVPIAAGAMRAAAIDRDAARDAGRAEAIVRTVRPRGRVVGPVDAPVPPEVRELARDERHWVGEREAAASAPVALGIRPRR